jgi:hypothetical protein
VTAGDRECRRERSESRRAEQHEISDEAPRRFGAHQVQRPPRDERSLRMRHDVQWPRLLGEPAADEIREACRPFFDVLAPVEGEDLDGVASQFQVGAEQIVNGGDRSGRFDANARVGILFRVVGCERRQAQRVQLAAVIERQRGIDPDQAQVSLHVAEGAPHKARDDDHVVGAEEERHPRPGLPALLAKDLQVCESVGSDQPVRVAGLGFENPLSPRLVEKLFERSRREDRRVSLRAGRDQIGVERHGGLDQGS